MGRSRTTHAGVASTEKQDRFVRLIAQGVSNSEACRQVGINRRTGTRWRFGRTVQNTAGVDVHYAPVRSVTPSTRHPRDLSLDERMVIADLRRARWTLRDIADELGRSPSTISRELRRNADDRGRYLPASADKAAVERISRPRARSPRNARPFMVDDVRRLDRLRPWLAHAFRRSPSGDGHQGDEASISTAGPTVLSGQLIVTPDASLLHQTTGLEHLLTVLAGEPANYTHFGPHAPSCPRRF